MNIGHSHPRIAEAVSAQIGKISHMAFQVGAYEPYIALAAKLNAAITPTARVSSPSAAAFMAALCWA